MHDTISQSDFLKPLALFAEQDGIYNNTEQRKAANPDTGLAGTSECILSVKTLKWLANPFHAKNKVLVSSCPFSEKETKESRIQKITWLDFVSHGPILLNYQSLHSRPAVPTGQN